MRDWIQVQYYCVQHCTEWEIEHITQTCNIMLGQIRQIISENFIKVNETIMYALASPFGTMLHRVAIVMWICFSMTCWCAGYKGSIYVV